MRPRHEVMAEKVEASRELARLLRLAVDLPRLTAEASEHSLALEVELLHIAEAGA